MVARLMRRDRRRVGTPRSILSLSALLVVVDLATFGMASSTVHALPPTLSGAPVIDGIEDTALAIGPTSFTDADGLPTDNVTVDYGDVPLTTTAFDGAGEQFVLNRTIRLAAVNDGPTLSAPSTLAATGGVPAAVTAVWSVTSTPPPAPWPSTSPRRAEPRAPRPVPVVRSSRRVPSG